MSDYEENANKTIQREDAYYCEEKLYFKRTPPYFSAGGFLI